MVKNIQRWKSHILRAWIIWWKCKFHCFLIVQWLHCTAETSTFYCKYIYKFKKTKTISNYFSNFDRLIKKIKKMVWLCRLFLNKLPLKEAIQHLHCKRQTFPKSLWVFCKIYFWLSSSNHMHLMYMNLQTVLVSEGPSAQVTFMWLFPSVH